MTNCTDTEESPESLPERKQDQLTADVHKLIDTLARAAGSGSLDSPGFNTGMYALTQHNYITNIIYQAPTHISTTNNISITIDTPAWQQAIDVTEKLSGKVGQDHGRHQKLLSEMKSEVVKQGVREITKDSYAYFKELVAEHLPDYAAIEGFTRVLSAFIIGG